MQTIEQLTGLDPVSLRKAKERLETLLGAINTILGNSQKATQSLQNGPQRVLKPKVAKSAPPKRRDLLGAIAKVLPPEKRKAGATLTKWVVRDALREKKLAHLIQQKDGSVLPGDPLTSWFARNSDPKRNAGTPLLKKTKEHQGVRAPAEYELTRDLGQV